MNAEEPQATAIIAEKHAHIKELHGTIEYLNDKLHVERVKLIVANKEKAVLVELLERVFHSGPTANTLHKTSECWEDCIACARDRLTGKK